MDAREFFEDVADASWQHREAETLLLFGQPRRPAPRCSGGMGDPVGSRFESDEEARAIMEATEERIGEGLRRIAELRRIYARKADVLELHYVDLMPWADVAREMGIARSTAIRWRGELFDWVDSFGWARLREGKGVAMD